jgi:hypothetical protein
LSHFFLDKRPGWGLAAKIPESRPFRVVLEGG